MDLILISVLMVAIVAGGVALLLWIERQWKRLRGRFQDAPLPRRPTAEELDAVKDYMADPKLLRGHDLVIAQWAQEIKGRHEPAFEQVALVVMAATAVEHHFGRRYDGRLIEQGWLSPSDYDAYFTFIDSYGDFSARAFALLRDAGFFMATAIMQTLNKGKAVPWLEIPKGVGVPIVNADLQRIADYWKRYAEQRGTDLIMRSCDTDRESGTP